MPLARLYALDFDFEIAKACCPALRSANSRVAAAMSVAITVLAFAFVLDSEDPIAGREFVLYAMFI
jgi:hypothetical protein